MPDPIFGRLPWIWAAICNGTTEIEGGPLFMSIIVSFLFDKCVFTRPEEVISYPNIFSAISLKIKNHIYQKSIEIIVCIMYIRV